MPALAEEVPAATRAGLRAVQAPSGLTGAVIGSHEIFPAKIFLEKEIELEKFCGARPLSSGPTG
jgi:hypothetical protein